MLRIVHFSGQILSNVVREQCICCWTIAPVRIENKDQNLKIFYNQKFVVVTY